jgi:cysteine desulfurase/selenocysteine lyase
MLTRILMDGLRIIPGITLITPSDDESRAGIVSIQLPARADGDAVFNRMQHDGVTVAVREGKLRYSPHFYNTPEEMTGVVDLTRRCLEQP